MRAAPLLLLVLLAALGLGLGARVMLQAPVATASLVPGGGATGKAASTAADVAGIPQGHVYTGITEEPEDVNPFTTHGNAARRCVLAFTHEALLDSDPATGELRPALAARFEPSADGTSCTFTLRDGVQFADGSPLTMDDVMFGWELAQSGHVPLGFVGDAFGRLSRVEVLDDKRLRVHWKSVHYAAVRAVGESWVVANRRFFVDRVAEQAKLAGIAAPPVGSPDFGRLFGQVDLESGPGTGPYELHNRPDGRGNWRRRQDLLLTRNEHCWRRRAAPGCWNFAGIRLLFRDQAAAFTCLLRHEVDWFSSPTIDDVLQSRSELRDAYAKYVYDYRTLGVFRIVWNCGRPPLDDARVRRALGMLFDLDAVLAVFGHHGTKAKAFAKPDSPEYPTDVPALPFDPALARRQLRELGFDPAAGNPLRIRLLAPQGLDAMRRTLDLFADAAKHAGVELETHVREYSAFVNEKKTGDWDALFVQQLFRPWGDPFDFVHSQGMDNDGHWRHPEADRLAEAARAELAPERRAPLLRELHSLVYREQPTAFLVHPKVAMLLNVHVENATVGPLGLVLERAFVRPEFQRK